MRTLNVVAGGDDEVVAQARSWLAATDLAGDMAAAQRLSRAIAPARYGFGQRRPLQLHGSPDRTDLILGLLRASQVPTAAAVDAAPSTTHPVEGAATQHLVEDIACAQRILESEHASLGENLSAAVALYRIEYGHGPTWQKAWAFDAVEQWWNAQVGARPPFTPVGQSAFAALHRAGWLASNRTARSLCSGRRFYTRFHGDHVSPLTASAVGFGVARFIGLHRRVNQCGPSWAEVAAQAVDPKGIPFFFNETDARLQQLWLATEGWIRLDVEGCLRRGHRAKTECRRRADPRGQRAA